MAVILTAVDDAATVSILTQTVESLGHTPLTVLSTENIVEDVVLNGVEMVLLASELAPFSGWEACEMLRADPTVPKDLPVLLITRGRGNVRRLEKSGFSATLDPAAAAIHLRETITRLLGDRAAPQGTGLHDDRAQD